MQPSLHNPTGVTMSAEAAGAIIDTISPPRPRCRRRRHLRLPRPRRAAGDRRSRSVPWIVRHGAVEEPRRGLPHRDSSRRRRAGRIARLALWAYDARGVADFRRPRGLADRRWHGRSRRRVEAERSARAGGDRASDSAADSARDSPSPARTLAAAAAAMAGVVFRDRCPRARHSAWRGGNLPGAARRQPAGDSCLPDAAADAGAAARALETLRDLLASSLPMLESSDLSGHSMAVLKRPVLGAMGSMPAR